MCRTYCCDDSYIIRCLYWVPVDKVARKAEVCDVMDAGHDVDLDEDERECLHLHHTGVLDWLAHDTVVINNHRELDDKLVEDAKVALVVIVAPVDLW